jgi:putative transposase
MKKSRFTDSQIAEASKRVEAGLAFPELCREMGISSATFYEWGIKRPRRLRNRSLALNDVHHRGPFLLAVQRLQSSSTITLKKFAFQKYDLNTN